MEEDTGLQQGAQKEEQQPTIEDRLDKLEAELATLKIAVAAGVPLLTALLEKHGIRAPTPAAT
jgi:hypothetical protein